MLIPGPGRGTVTIFTIVLLTVTAGCGGSSSGGGDTSVTGSNTCIDFTPDGTPAANTVIASKGASSSCNRVAVELLVTDVNDIFAAVFDVTFNANRVQYDGFSEAGSVLGSDGATLQVVETPASGSVNISISRFNVATGVNATGSRVLGTLFFRKVLDSGASNLGFQNPRLFDSSAPPQVKPGITWFGGDLVIR